VPNSQHVASAGSRRIAPVLSEFWSLVAGKLTDRWLAILTPATVFWAGGFSAWAFPGSGRSRLPDLTARLASHNVADKVVALLGAVLIVAISAIVVQRLALPVLRLLEGYWPAWLRTLTAGRRARVRRRKAADEEAWQQLQSKLETTQLTPEDRAKLAGLEHRRHHRPVRDHELLPTRVGNILRAAETRPYHRYGLEAVVIWPRLWLVLPDLARQELSAARAGLDASVAAVIWGLAFMAFTPLAWWAAPVGAFTAATAAVWWVPSRAEVFADLMEGAYDLYRAALYRQLRWPPPANPAEELQIGHELTRYLVRGSDKPYPEFTPPPGSDSPPETPRSNLP
jgi:hypothetical protein